jgi:hypothetical protein
LRAASQSAFDRGCSPFATSQVSVAWASGTTSRRSTCALGDDAADREVPAQGKDRPGNYLSSHV